MFTPTDPTGGRGGAGFEDELTKKSLQDRKHPTKPKFQTKRKETSTC